MQAVEKAGTINIDGDALPTLCELEGRHRSNCVRNSGKTLMKNSTPNKTDVTRIVKLQVEVIGDGIEY